MSEKVFGSQKPRSIKDIPMPEHNNSLHLSNESTPNSTGTPQRQKKVQDWKGYSRRNKRTRTKLIGAAILLCLLLVCYSFVFHGAQVVIAEKKQSVVIANQEFSAQLQSDGDTIEFIRVNPFSKTERIHVPGSLEENRQTKTQGVITVFNTDTVEKKYIKNTRFESPEGNIYRAFQRFIIPAGTKDVPGSVDVLVVAENPGDKYNSTEGLSFVLPALKEQGDPSYDLVYAQQKEPLRGGYSGIVRVPIDSDIEQAKRELSSRLQESLFAEFKETLETTNPGLYVVKEELVSVSEPVFIETPNEEKGGLDLEARAELVALVFAREQFDSFMAQQLINEYDHTTDTVAITNIDDLSFTLNEEQFEAETATTLNYSIVGEAQFVWTIEVEQIKKLLAGKLQSHIESGLVVGIDHVEILDISVSPFWRRALPQNSEQISIEIK